MTQSSVDTLCCGEPFSLSLALCDRGKRARCFASHCTNIHDSTTALKIPLSVFVLWKTALLSYFVMIAFTVMSAIAADNEVCFLKLQQYLACLIE